MSDRVEEREAVMREREAFREGVRWQEARHRAAGGAYRQFDTTMNGRAKERYPLPKVSRPRVVKDPESSCFEFRYLGTVSGFQSREIKPNVGEWEYANAFGLSPLRVRCWADLLANPTELVEAD